MPCPLRVPAGVSGRHFDGASVAVLYPLPVGATGDPGGAVDGCAHCNSDLVWAIGGGAVRTVPVAAPVTTDGARGTATGTASSSIVAKTPATLSPRQR